ncbi:uncharacterized protein TNCV_4776931 [Trichonephila clavipes]|nr:uncharacterized protein TNCV_4776931 [Trichonephila clavipes]
MAAVDFLLHENPPTGAAVESTTLRAEGQLQTNYANQSALGVAYPHRPMTLHSSTENSLAVLNHKILEANSQVQNVKLGGHQTCLPNVWHELCDMLRRLVGTTTPGHDCSIQE